MFNRNGMKYEKSKGMFVSYFSNSKQTRRTRICFSKLFSMIRATPMEVAKNGVSNAILQP